jgi:hypothetical protein
VQTRATDRVPQSDDPLGEWMRWRDVGAAFRTTKAIRFRSARAAARPARRVARCDCTVVARCTGEAACGFCGRGEVKSVTRRSTTSATDNEDPAIFFNCEARRRGRVFASVFLWSSHNPSASSATPASMRTVTD